MRKMRCNQKQKQVTIAVQTGFLLTPRRDHPSGERRGKEGVFFCIFVLEREVIGYIK